MKVDGKGRIPGRYTRTIISVLMMAMVLVTGAVQRVEAVEYRTGSRWYIPETLPEGEKLRGVVIMYYRNWLAEPRWRDMAVRARVALSNGPGSSSIAAALGRPEIAHLPEVRIGCSRGGFEEWEDCVNNRLSRTIAVISHDGRNHWWDVSAKALDTSMSEYRLPLLHTSGGIDFVRTRDIENAHRKVRKQAHGIWSSLLKEGAGHCGFDDEGLDFHALWVEDVIGLRVRGEIPADRTPDLTTLNDRTDGYLVDYTLATPPSGPHYFTQATAHDPASVPAGTAGDYIWMPSQRVAKAFVNYVNTCRLEGGDGIGIAGTRLGNAWLARVGQGQDFYLYGTGAEGPITWSIVEGSLPAGLTQAGNGHFTGTLSAVGDYSFTIQAKDAQGNAATKVFSGGVGAQNDNEDPVAAITQPQTGTSVSLGSEVTFTGVAIDPEEDNVSDRLEWYSNLDGKFGDGPAVTTNALQPGVHEITLVARDTGGRLDAHSIALTVVGSTATRLRAIMSGEKAMDHVQVFELNGRRLAKVPQTSVPGARQTMAETRLTSRGIYIIKTSDNRGEIVGCVSLDR